jgi:hypothetical protein
VALLMGVLLGSGVISVQKHDAGAKGDAESDGDGQESGDGKKRRKGKTRRGKNPDLDSLAYLNSVPITEKDRGKQGVVLVDEAKAFDGLTLLNPCFGGVGPRIRGKPIHEAKLWDLQGKVVHSWEAAPRTGKNKKSGWAIARLDDEGYLYVIFADTSLVKLDWEGKVVWELEQTFHHDFNFDNDGNIVAINEQRRLVPRLGGDKGSEVRILDHGIAFVTRDGEVKRQIWLYDAMKDDPVFTEELARRIEQKEKKDDDADLTAIGGLDIFHANSIQVLPRDVDGLGKKGDLLTSSRHLDTIAVLDRKTGQVVWSWGAEDLQHQHDPTITPDGQIVVFDNGTKRKRSRVLVVDPKTKQIVRTFDGGQDRFFSAGRGLAQALPNGNLLVFISNQARVIEIMPDDEIVWEFYGSWIRDDARFPLRGVRLEGKTQERVLDILAGRVEPPKAGAAPPAGESAAEAKSGDGKADGSEAKADEKTKGTAKAG